MHRNVVINDDFGTIMASVNHSGMIMASKGAENGEDNGEMDDFIRPDDEDEDMDDDPEAAEKRRKKHCHIQFKPFNTWKNLKDWHFALKYGEQVECLSIGSGWCAAATDFGYIRVFSIEGV